MYAARPGGGSADDVDRRSSLDANAGLIRQGAGHRGVGANGVALGAVVAGEGPRDKNAIPGVAGNQIAGADDAASDRVSGGAGLNRDPGGIGHLPGTSFIGAG